MGLPAMIHEYGGVKLGNFLLNLVDDINPVQLSKANTAQKNPNLFGNAKAMKDLVGSKRGSSTDPAMSLSEFFKGKKIGARLSEDPKKRTSFGEFIKDDNDAVRASTRTIGAGAIAAFGLAPMVLGEDNFVSRTVKAGATLGAHAAITATALRSGGKTLASPGAMFGVGYGGLAAVNAIRSGNNFGPF